MAKASPYFSDDTFKFLRQLAKHNNRDWFMANKARYESSVRGPALRLIADLADPFKDIAVILLPHAWDVSYV